MPIAKPSNNATSGQTVNSTKQQMTTSSDSSSKSTKQATTKRGNSAENDQQQQQQNRSKETSQEKEQLASQFSSGMIAPTTGGNKTPLEQPEFVKQVLITIEKKVRNLEKRKIKLEEYREMQRKGESLNEDQLLAVSRFDEVLRTLEMSRELEKQFISLANDAIKQQKKQAKKEQIEREELVRDRLRETQKYLAILNTLQTNEQLRSTFVQTNVISEKELEFVGQFSRFVLFTELSQHLNEKYVNDSAEHLNSLLESKTKQIPITSGDVVMNYGDLRKVLDRVMTSPYWNPDYKPEQPKEEVEQVAAVESVQQELNGVSLSEQQQPIETVQQQEEQVLVQHSHAVDQQQHIIEQQQQQHYQQESYHENNQYSIQDSNYHLIDENSTNATSSHQQDIQKTTFFTTLSSTDVAHGNIDEFLNKCENSDEGINFLQDSEIQQQQQQQHQQQHHEIEQQQQQNVVHQQQHHQQQQQQQHHQQQQQQRQRYENSQSGHYDHQQQQQPRHYNNRDNQEGGYRGGMRSTQQDQRPRYTDDRRGTGPQQPRQQQQQRVPQQQMQGGNGVPHQQNGGGGYRSNNGGGYRGPQQQQQGGGGYRGPRGPANGPRNDQQQQHPVY